jgi:hypothetical protein
MPLSGTQEECCLKNAESFGLNLFWYSAIYHRFFEALKLVISPETVEKH